MTINYLQIITRLLLLIGCTIYFIETNAQINYSSKNYRITFSETGYVETISMRGNIVDKKGSLIQIIYTGLEKIEDVSLIYSNKKLRKIKQKDFITTGLETSSFYAGLNSLQYYVSSPTSFELKYNSKGSDLMYLSTLDFHKYYTCDTIKYELVLPLNYYFSYDIPYKIEGLKIDSSQTYINKIFIFTLIENQGDYEKNADEPSKSRFIVNNNLFKSVRVQISKNNNPDQTFNNWYMNLLKGVGNLTKRSKLEVDSVVAEIDDKDKIIETLFKYVQSKIRYIDIEDGISAFKPRNVNDILYNKQGDCKDMANLLVQALIYKGFDAHMALSSSLSHRFNLDFPNVASANHVLCVVNRNNQWIMLDATDKHCKYLNPSMHTQGRNIFIIDNKENYYQKIEKIPYKENLDSTFLILEINNGILNGKFFIEKNGLSNSSYYSSKDYFNNNTFEDLMLRDVKQEYSVYKIDELKHEVKSNKTFISFVGRQKVPTSTTINNKNYLAVNSFLVYPHQFPKKIKSNEKLLTYETIYKKGMVQIKFNNEIRLHNLLETSFKHQELEFKFETHIVDNKTIELSYVLIINEVELKDDLVLKYNQMNEIISDIFNKTIVYENVY